MRKYLSGSTAFLMTFNLSTSGSSYCSQIAFDIFNTTLIKRNGKFINDDIEWGYWSSIS